MPRWVRIAALCAVVGSCAPLRECKPPPADTLLGRRVMGMWFVISGPRASVVIKVPDVEALRRVRLNIPLACGE